MGWGGWKIYLLCCHEDKKPESWLNHIYNTLYIFRISSFKIALQLSCLKTHVYEKCSMRLDFLLSLSPIWLLLAGPPLSWSGATALPGLRIGNVGYKWVVLKGGRPSASGLGLIGMGLSQAALWACPGCADRVGRNSERNCPPGYGGVVGSGGRQDRMGGGRQRRAAQYRDGPCRGRTGV